MEYLKKLKILSWKQKRGLINVNCWFCDEFSQIDAENCNWWYCYNCEQYNGFNEDGDYNEEIPSMLKNNRANQQYCETKGGDSQSKSILCLQCQNNQKKKINEMAMFQPSKEESFGEECSAYEKYLNEKYKPCLACTVVVNRYLDEQDKDLMNTYQDGILRSSKQYSRQLNKSNMIVNEEGRKSFLLIVLKMSLHLISLCGSSWFLQNEYFSPAISELKSAILLPPFCILMLLFCITYLIKKFNGGIFISAMLWTFALISKLSPTHKKTRLALTVVVAFDICCMTYPLLHLLSQLRQKYKHSKERSRRIEKLHEVSFKRKSIVTSQSTDETSSHLKLEEEKRKEFLSSEIDSKRDYKKGVSLTRHEDEKSMHPVTPDLLEGHLDAMFIATAANKANEREYVSHDPKNHVIAALKYRQYSTPTTATVRNNSNSILKPATLMLNNDHLDRQTIQTTNHDALNNDHLDRQTIQTTKRDTTTHNDKPSNVADMTSSIAQQRRRRQSDDVQPTHNNTDNDKRANMLTNFFIRHTLLFSILLFLSISLNIYLHLCA